MLRPRVTHSAAHRNIRQKRPWMEYSGTTSWGGVRVRSQWSGARMDPMAQRGNDVGKCQPTMISELKGLSG